MHAVRVVYRRSHHGHDAEHRRSGRARSRCESYRRIISMRLASVQFLGADSDPEEGDRSQCASGHGNQLSRHGRDRYNGDPNIIGKTQYLNGVQHTIIGVAPENFHGTFVGYSFQFWVPTSMQETFDSTGYKLEDRGARWIEGLRISQTWRFSCSKRRPSISAVAKRLEKDYPETNRGHGVQLFPLWKTPFNQAGAMCRPRSRITMAVVLFVLLIACANVSNLFLARSLLTAA